MPTWKRKKILAFAAPRIPEEFPTTENIWQDCPREIEVKSLEESDKPNAFEQHYVNEVKELIDKSKMIAFFHANDLGTRSTRRVSYYLYSNVICISYLRYRFLTNFLGFKKLV